MSKSVNTAFLIGHVGNPPELRTTSKGTRVANLSLATNDGWGDNEKTNWHRITVFGKLVDIVEQYVRKGDRLFIEGRIDYDSYEKDGHTVYTTSIIVDDLVMLGRQEAPKAPAATGVDSDMPF